MFFEEIGRDGIIFADPSVGFDFTFDEYIQKLHFPDTPSFSSVVKSHAEIFGSPGANRSRALLSGACFLLQAVQEYAAVGIDANGIVLGGERAEEKNTSYADRIQRRVFPPRRLFDVTSVVADGNAKILTNRIITPPMPNREVAPRKRRDGPKTPPKPYWAGWFFSICIKPARILQAVPIFRPGNNAIVLNELGNVVGRYPFANFLIYNRACKIHIDVNKEGGPLKDKDLQDRQVPRIEAQDILTCKSSFGGLVEEANTGPEHQRRRSDCRPVSMVC